MGRTYQVLASPKDNTSYPVYLKIDKKTIKYAGTFSFFYTYLEKSRESIISFLENSFSSSHNFQLWQALSLGKCSDLSIKHRFQRLGLSHFLAISGFHFSMFFAMLSLLVSWLSSGVYRLLLLTFFLSFYLFLTSSPPSAIRAFLMILTFIITSTLNRRYNALTAWSLALLLMTLFNPSYVYQVGFTLSFIASLSIILLYHPFQKFFLRKSLFLLHESSRLLQKLLTYFIKNISLLLSIYTFTLPFILFFFGTFSCLGMLYNLLISPLIALLFFLCLLIPIFIFIFPFFKGPCLYCIEYLIQILLIMLSPAQTYSLFFSPHHLFYWLPVAIFSFIFYKLFFSTQNSKYSLKVTPSSKPYIF